MQDFTDDLADDRSEADLALTRPDRTESDCRSETAEERQRRFSDIHRDDAEDPRRPAG